jgi:cytochrome c5
VTHLRKLAPLLAATVVAAAPFAANADEGEKIFKDSCTSCHDAKTRPLDAVRMDREKWKEAVERMEGQGATIPSGKKLSDLLDYLVRTHGPDVPVKAPAK